MISLLFVLALNRCNSEQNNIDLYNIKTFNSTPIPCNNQTSFCITGSYQRAAAKIGPDQERIDVKEINGEYVYDGCSNGSAYFININRDVPMYLYWWGGSMVKEWIIRKAPDPEHIPVVPKNIYFIGEDLKLSAFAACDEEYLFNCSHKMEIYNAYNIDDPWELDSNVYVGDCDVLINDPSYCNKSISYMDDGFCLYDLVSADYMFLNGKYEIIGCHENHPYFQNSETNIYIYYDYDFGENDIIQSDDQNKDGEGIWIISDELGNININDNQQVYGYCASQDLPLCTEWYIDGKLYNVNGADCSVKLSERNKRRIKLILICPTIFFVFVAVISLFIWFKNRKEAINEQKNSTIEMQNVSKENNNSDITKELQTETEQTESSWKCWLKHPNTFLVLGIIFKHIVNIYDYYTDIMLAKEWMNGYDVTFVNGKICKKLLFSEGMALIIASTVGFLFGICSGIAPYIVEYKYKHPGKGEVSGQLLTALKCLFEDIITICITLQVGLQALNSNLSDAFYQAYYMSVFSLFLSAFTMIVRRGNKSKSKWKRISFIISMFLLFGSVILSYFPIFAEMTILQLAVDAPLVVEDEYYAAMIFVNGDCYDTNEGYFRDESYQVVDANNIVQTYRFSCKGEFLVQSKAQLLSCTFRHIESGEEFSNPDEYGACSFRLFAGQCVFDSCWSLPDLEVCFDILEF